MTTIEAGFTLEDVREALVASRQPLDLASNTCPVARVASRIFGYPCKAGGRRVWERFQLDPPIATFTPAVDDVFDNLKLKDMTPELLYDEMVTTLGSNKIVFQAV